MFISSYQHLQDTKKHRQPLRPCVKYSKKGPKLFEASKLDMLSLLRSWIPFCRLSTDSACASGAALLRGVAQPALPPTVYVVAVFPRLQCTHPRQRYEMISIVAKGKCIQVVCKLETHHVPLDS
eukprot:1923369-Amphidinium_carterae.1